MEKEQFGEALKAAFAGGATLNSLEAAKNVLLSGKRNECRFIAWNILLGVLTGPPERWPSEATTHYNWYWNVVKGFFKDCPNWSEVTDENIRSAADMPVEEKQLMFDIHNDVIRTCLTLLRDFSPGKKLSPDIHRRVERILYTIAQFSPEMGYAQGFDRYSFILYIFSLEFCELHELSSDFAESFAYSLTVRFLLLIHFHKFIGSETSLMDWIGGYQSLLDRFQPEISLYLTKLNVSPVQYVFRWVALLFADEHSPEELFLLWDQILLHSADTHRYVFCCSVAHVSQIYASIPEGKGIVELLHKFREWNMTQLISDTNKYYEASLHPEKQQSCCLSFTRLFSREA